MPAVPVQIVFQGGGAKLCPLMGVCEVLQKYQSDGRIKINRVAGSSAGAIAAVMLASGRPIADFKLALHKLADQHLPLMSVSRTKGAWRVYRGESWFKGIELSDIFNELFCKNGSLQYVNKLPIPTNIYTTDLYSLSSKPLHNESIPQALAKSCNFPFAFIGAASDQIDVDGGLALNLPVDDLHQDKASGDVIAISFSNTFTKREGSPFLSFSKNLFSASIQSGVNRSRQLIGEQNVFSVDTDIDTFDFHRIPLDGLTDVYVEAQKAFGPWLSTWLTPYERTPNTHSSHFVRATIGSLNSALMRQIDNDLKTTSRIQGKELFASDVAILDSSGGFTGRYRTNLSMSFEVIQPTSVIQMAFQTGAEDQLTDANLLCAVSTSTQEIPFTARVQQAGKVDDGMRPWRLYYYFDEELKPEAGEVISLEYQYEAADPYPKFGASRELAAMAPKLGNMDAITLVVAFPKSRAKTLPVTRDLKDLSETERQELGLTIWGEPVASEALPYGSGVAGRLRLDRTLNEYHVVGRTARDVKKGQLCGFVVE